MAVAPYHQLCQVLIYWLLSERLTEHGRCGDMLNHCFATMPYEICSVCIPHHHQLAVHICVLLLTVMICSL
jgi:hypothetical protein